MTEMPTMIRRTKVKGCEACDFRGLIFNTMLKKSIRCPYCMRRARRDGSGLQAVNAAEKRRNIRERARMEALAFLAATSYYRAPLLATQYLPIDRIMQRWAVGMGDGLPDPDNDPQSRPPPLDDATQVVVDLIVQHSPRDDRWFVRQWYCDPVPVCVMARQRAMDPPKLHDVHESVLACLRSRFQSSRHADLIALLTGRL